jgi:hypothetical protein
MLLDKYSFKRYNSSHKTSLVQSKLLHSMLARTQSSLDQCIFTKHVEKIWSYVIICHSQFTISIKTC